MKRKVNKAIFEVQMNEHIEAMEAIVNQTMLNNGDKCFQSQKICVLQAINNIGMFVNGSTEKDFKDE